MQRSNRNGLIVTLPAGTQVDGIVPASVKRQKPKVEAPPLETTEDQAECKLAEVERQKREQFSLAKAAAMEKALEADALAHTEQEAALKERLSIEEASKRQTSDDTPPTPDDDGEFA